VRQEADYIGDKPYEADQGKNRNKDTPHLGMTLAARLPDSAILGCPLAGFLCFQSIYGLPVGNIDAYTEPLHGFRCRMVAELS
jgi:hypothetical protein